MNTEQLRAELLPCPFCGGEAFMEEHPPHKHSDWLVKVGMPEYSAGSFTIECVACECGMIHESRDSVVAAWNRRAALQSQTMPYAGVTVWVGNKRCSHGVTKDELELSAFDILQAAFDHARMIAAVSRDAFEEPNHDNQ